MSSSSKNNFDILPLEPLLSTSLDEMDWDSVQAMVGCLTQLPCFMLIYWVDFLADCSSPLSIARLWPSAPVYHCILLLYFYYSVPCAIFIQTVWRWVMLLACRICLVVWWVYWMIILNNSMVNWKTCNDIFVYFVNTAVMSNGGLKIYL